jgi:hypothetical protein
MQLCLTWRSIDIERFKLVQMKTRGLLGSTPKESWAKAAIHNILEPTKKKHEYLTQRIIVIYINMFANGMSYFLG